MRISAKFHKVWNLKKTSLLLYGTLQKQYRKQCKGQCWVNVIWNIKRWSKVELPKADKSFVEMMTDHTCRSIASFLSRRCATDSRATNLTSNPASRWLCWLRQTLQGLGRWWLLWLDQPKIQRNYGQKMLCQLQRLDFSRKAVIFWFEEFV